MFTDYLSIKNYPLKSLAKYRLVYNRTGNLLKDGTDKGRALIQIEVYHYKSGKAQRKYISTGIYVEPKHWDEENKRVKRHEHVNEYNKIIEAQVKVINDYLVKEGESFEWDRFERFLDGTYGQTFNDFVRMEIESNNKITSKALTQHWATHKHLENFRENISFMDVDYDMIKDFDRYMRGKKLKDSTIYGHHKRLRHYVNESVRGGYISPQNDPYKSFKPKTVKYETVKYLQESELVRLRDFDLSSNKKLERVRDFYVFCCYTGLAYQDAVNLKKRDIIREEGEMFIHNPRLKTDEQVVLILFDEAVNILKKYKYQLPVISNQKTNDFLKIIADMVDIDKNLTTHTARHTCAVLLLNKGMRMETVSRWLGHSSPKTTMETYARVLKTTIKNEALEVKKKLL
jgi:integrase/recombinase XerD